MKTWLKLVGALLLAAAIAFAGVWLRRDPGQLQLRWLGWQVDSSVAFVLLALLLVVALLWLLDGLLRRFPRNWRRRREERRRAELRDGWRALLEGRQALARRLLLRASLLPEQHALALYGAALAAEAGDDPGLADELLGTLLKTPFAAAAQLQQAGFRLRRGQVAEGLAELGLAAEQGQLPAAWRETVLARLQHGQAVLALQQWPQLLAAKVLNRRELAELEQRLVPAALAASADAAALEATWQQLDRGQRERPAAVLALARRAAELERLDLLLEVLPAALEREPVEALQALYGSLPFADPRAALKRAEGWLAAQPQSPGLLLSLARLCRRQELWGKAREALARGLALAPADPALWEELGHWASAQGDLKLARLAFLNALRGARGEAVEPLEALPVRSLGGGEASESAVDERGRYGFPVAPG